jgi:hypothetical protein
MLARDRGGWTQVWSEKIAGSDFSRKRRRGEAQGCAEQSHSRRYDLSEGQIQACLDLPGRG